MTSTLLKIEASARYQGSVSRDLTSAIAARLGASKIVTRDLAQTPLPQLDETWIGANFTPPDSRTAAQNAALALSDRLVEELEAADTIVIGVPIYNFGIPAALKAWIDLVARAGRTFRYTENGPRGLLTGKRAVLAVASGGTPAGSEIDFATTYMRHVLGFLGITEVEIIAADQLGNDPKVKRDAAQAAIEKLAA